MSVYISHQYSVVFLSHIQFRACKVRNIWRYTSVDLSLKCSMSRLVSLYNCRLVVIFLFPFTTDSLYSFFCCFHLRLSACIRLFSIYDCQVYSSLCFHSMTTRLHSSLCFPWWLSVCIYLVVSIQNCQIVFIFLVPFTSIFRTVVGVILG